MRGIKNLRPLSSSTKKEKGGKGEELGLWHAGLAHSHSRAFFHGKKEERGEGNFFEGINFEREEEENFFPFWKSGLVESTTAWVCVCCVGGGSTSSSLSNCFPDVRTKKNKKGILSLICGVCFKVQT